MLAQQFSQDGPSVYEMSVDEMTNVAPAKTIWPPMTP
jgi:hypothetical protein